MEQLTSLVSSVPLRLPSSLVVFDETEIIMSVFLICEGIDGSSAEKTSWPELVGLTPEEAEKKIKEESPKISVQVVPPNSFVTMDYRLDRVRIFVDTSGKVARSPTLG